MALRTSLAAASALAAMALSAAPFAAQAPTAEPLEYRFGPGPLAPVLEAALAFEGGVGWAATHVESPPLRDWDPLAWSASAWAGVGWAAATLRDASDPGWLAIDHAIRFALSSDRDDDAWRHAARHDPGMLAARLAWFLPGVDERLYTGEPLRLPAGVTLRPALPPPTGLGGVPERRAMELVGFRVGEAKVAMKVSVEGDGIELEFRHLEGPRVEFNAVIPCPPRLAMTVEYANWEEQEGFGLPRKVVLEPGAAPYRLWGRYVPAPPAWPGHAPLELTKQMDLAGFELLVPADTPEGDDGLPGFAKLVEEVTGRPCPVVRGDPPIERVGPAPVVIDLRSPERRAQKVSALLSLVERHVLGPDLGVAPPAREKDD